MVLRFLFRCVLCAVPVVIMLAAFIAWHHGHFPAPRATNNLALNEKAAAFASQDLEHPDLLLFGSSMALNNIHSEAISARFNTTDWFDMGAWGLDMVQTCALADAVSMRWKPSTVVVVGNLMDFAESEQRSSLEVAPVLAMMNNGRSPWEYARHPAMVYYLRQAGSNAIRYSDRANYECLMMDRFGCVPLDVPLDRIIPDRWNKPVPAASELADAQYAALDQLAAASHERGTRLVYIGTPYRSGVLGQEQRTTVAAHARRVRAIIEKHGHAYVDAADRDWPDASFCDSSHLNGAGAAEFTAHVMAALPAK